MARASDDAIWELARDGGFTIVSKDGDFQQRSFVHGPPPKVVWLKVGNCSTQDVERVIRSRHAEILRFLEAQDAALLVLS